jgi:hypothetical protein
VTAANVYIHQTRLTLANYIPKLMATEKETNYTANYIPKLMTTEKETNYTAVYIPKLMEQDIYE